jgi:hypothetical protein
MLLLHAAPRACVLYLQIVLSLPAPHSAAHQLAQAGWQRQTCIVLLWLQKTNRPQTGARRGALAGGAG